MVELLALVYLGEGFFAYRLLTKSTLGQKYGADQDGDGRFYNVLENKTHAYRLLNVQQVLDGLDNIVCLREDQFLEVLGIGRWDVGSRHANHRCIQVVKSRRYNTQTRNI